MTLYFRQNLHVSNLSDLTAEVGVSVGFVAWVDGYGKYVAAPENTFTIDGLHVIAGQDGVQWADESSLYVKNWAVTDWYLDGYVGSDTNDGITESSPIKTGAELLRRLGPYAMWGQSVTVHVLANGMTDALILRGAMMVAGTHLDVIGTPTELATSTVATYSAVNHTTATASHITAATIADWTPYVWRRIRITDGARLGAVTWIGKANPHGTGLETARVCPPCNINQASTTTNITAVLTLALGDTITVESLPLVPSITIQLDGPVDNSAGVQWTKRQWSLQHIDSPSIMINTTSAMLSGKNLVYGCRISSIIAEFIGQTPFYNTVGGCSVYAATPSLNVGGISGLYVAQNCLFGDNGLVVLYAGAMNRYTSCLFQACQLGGQIGSEMVCSNVQVFDVLSAAHGGLAPNNGVFTNVSGRDNAGYGLGLLNMTTTRFTGTCNMQGTIAPAAFLSPPVVPFATMAAFLQPSDYAQKGTATLVAGTVTVTVPWWDPTTQKLTVSHADCIGIIGDLSTPTAGQTNTQFVIDSTFATDLSTVNWEISPLGRNIFISTV